MLSHNRKGKGMPAAESGNVIFIILIAIALLAALTFTATRMSRSGGSMSKEDATFAANSIMQFGQAVHNAVQQLVTNGVSVQDVSFENSVASGYDHPSPDVHNNVFDTSGGGVIYVAPDAAWLDTAFSAHPLYGQWYFPADICGRNVGTGGAACNTDGNGNGEDMMITLPFIKREICLSINRRLGLPDCGGDVCETSNDMDSYANTKFQGTFVDGAIFGPASGEYDNKFEGCIRGHSTSMPDPPAYYYYKVLVDR